MTPEQKLWLHALKTQFTDALTEPRGGHSGKSFAGDSEIFAARAFLTNPSRDLNIMASLAGIEPICVLEKAKALEAANWPTSEREKWITRDYATTIRAQRKARAA